MPIFCYLGDSIGQSGGCADAATVFIHYIWKASLKLLLILTNPGIFLVIRGYVFTTCVCSILMYGRETWPLSKEDLEGVI